MVPVCKAAEAGAEILGLSPVLYCAINNAGEGGAIHGFDVRALPFTTINCEVML